MKTKERVVMSWLLFLWLIAVGISGCKDEEGKMEVPDPGVTEGQVEWECPYLDFSADGGIEEIGLDAGTDWKITVPDENWLTITPAEGKKGEDLILSVQVSSNESENERKACFIVKSLGNSAADTLTIRQAGLSRHIALDWENNAQLVSFNPESGHLQIHFKENPPMLTPEVSTIVVPTDTMSYIRVVKSVSGSGNDLTLQTEPGNMTDLFMNQEFTLSISPEPDAGYTRSGTLNTADKSGAIHPFKISVLTDEGKTVTVYDATQAARDEIKENHSFWKESLDLSGEDIYNNEEDTVRLFWRNCQLEADLDGKFYFKFGSEVKKLPNGLEVPYGTLQEYYFIMDGNVKSILDVALQTIKPYELPDDQKLQKLLADFVNVTYYFQVGSVVMPVTLKTDLMIESDFSTLSSALISGGVESDVDIRAGVRYINSLTPVLDISGGFLPCVPSLNFQGDVNMSATLYPYFKVELFNLAAPSIAYKNNVGIKTNIGESLSTVYPLAYFGWQGKVNNHHELEVSGSLDFAGITVSGGPFEFVTIEKTALTFPDVIELYSPDEEDEVYPVGEPIEVKFKVKAGILDTHQSNILISDVTVIAEPENGTVDNQYQSTDTKGVATFVYTPTAKDSRLKVRIVNAKKKTISSAVFAPNLKQKVVGVWNIGDGCTVIVNGQEVASANWKNVLIFNQDGTYSYEENPEKKVVVYNVSGKTKTLSFYSYCKGTYSYNEETRELSIHPETVIDNRIENGVPSPDESVLVVNLFGQEGTYKSYFTKNDDGTEDLVIRHKGFDGIDGSSFSPAGAVSSSIQSRSTYVVNESGQVEYKIE